MTPKTTYSPAGLLMAGLLLVAALCGGGALFSACGPPPAVEQDAGVPDLGEPDASATVDEGFWQRNQGNLPLGYYERQCQWDACGGPKDRGVGPAVNPAREDR